MKAFTVRCRSLLLAVLLASSVSACESDHTAGSRAKILSSHGPRVAEIVVDDLVRHRKGLRAGAKRIWAGFVKVEGEKQEQGMRQAMKVLRSPKRGVRELVISPMSFLAAVNTDGVVIARNAEPDRMKGMNLAKLFPVVQGALDGEGGYQIGEFKSLEKGGDPSVTVLMAEPVKFEERVVGALVLGIPLWRLQQRLSKQLQMEAAGQEKGAVIWVYIYRGDELHHHGTPRDLNQIVPDAATRKAGFARSPGGFTGSAVQFSFWYAYGVRPLRVLGDDIGAIIFRMDPSSS
ncbi:MAG: hypothetical protein OEZ06_26300 [Myxococcales bacterium]|nr:hypothetical protein [Myxococcales bacterium]